MSYFVVITFDNEDEARIARESLRNAQKQGYLELEDAVTITKGLDQKIVIKDEIDRGLKWGALGGSFLGMLIGGLFFPITGIVLGAIGGGLAGKWIWEGVDKDFKREVLESLQPGSSALFLVIPPAYLDYAIAALRPYQGQIYHSSIPEDAENELRAVLKQRVGTLENQILVLGFESQASADEVYKKVLEWHEKRIVNLDDAVIASRGIDDKVHIRQTKTLTGKYAFKGGGAGFLVGLLLGGPIAGLAIGAAAGAIAAKRKDIGIDDYVIQDVSGQIRPNTSLLFLLGKSLDPERLSKELSDLDAAVISTSLTDQEQDRLMQLIRGSTTLQS